MNFIMNMEIKEGYEKWRKLFLSVEDKRQKYGMKVLAYGHPNYKENKIYQVKEALQMEAIQEAKKDEEIAKLRTDAGVDLETQEVVFLVEQVKYLSLEVVATLFQGKKGKCGNSFNSEVHLGS